MACVSGIVVAGMTIACLRHHAHRLAAKKLGLGPEGGSFTHQEYQVRKNWVGWKTEVLKSQKRGETLTF